MNSTAEACNPIAAVPAVNPHAREDREGSLEIPGGLDLEHGGRLAPVRIAWRLAGASAAPVVAALGGISAHRNVFDAGDGPPGWWDGIVGPDQALDTRSYRVLGLDFLGGSADSTGPAAGRQFPSISTYDQAAILVRLLDHLQLPALHAIVGASYGAMVGLAFAARHPSRLQRLLMISGADVAHPMSTAWRSIQRRTVRFALEHDRGAAGLQLARALAMATYRSGAEFAERFSGSPRRDGRERFVFPVENYLFARGADYAAQYRPEAFLCLSESIDLHAVDVSGLQVPVTLIAVREDQLVPLADMRSLAARLPRARLHEISSLYGHDAFLKEREQLAPLFKQVLQSETP